jgi:hypothetical protein
MVAAPWAYIILDTTTRRSQVLSLHHLFLTPSQNHQQPLSFSYPRRSPRRWRAGQDMILGQMVSRSKTLSGRPRLWRMEGSRRWHWLASWRHWMLWMTSLRRSIPSRPCPTDFFSIARKVSDLHLQPG